MKQAIINCETGIVLKFFDCDEDISGSYDYSELHEIYTHIVSNEHEDLCIIFNNLEESNTYRVINIKQVVKYFMLLIMYDSQLIQEIKSNIKIEKNMHQVIMHGNEAEVLYIFEYHTDLSRWYDYSEFNDFTYNLMCDDASELQVNLLNFFKDLKEDNMHHVILVSEVIQDFISLTNIDSNLVQELIELIRSEENIIRKNTM